MPIEFSEFYPINDLFEVLKPMPVTPWDGTYVNEVGLNIPNRVPFVDQIPALNNGFIFKKGCYVIYSSIGPFFRIGFFDDEPLNNRIHKDLQEIIAYNGVGLNVANPTLMRNYARLRYFHRVETDNLFETFNDIYISVAPLDDITNDIKHNIRYFYKNEFRLRFSNCFGNLPNINRSKETVNIYCGSKLNNNINFLPEFVIHWPENFNDVINIALTSLIS